MCRFLAYRGDPVFLETVVTAPCHSLVHQSQHATESKTTTNGDGFGVGWYGEREMPGLYREVRPAWSDENLRSVCAQVRSRLFFAHVRAATGTATSRANCHPFSVGRHMFMHNGQVGGYAKLRRRIEAMIPDALYPERHGTTDSEAIFLAALARCATVDPVGALQSVLGEIKAMARSEAIAEPLRFAAAFTDGENLFAFRWSCDVKAPTLYWREDGAGLSIVSEPLDECRELWSSLDQNTVLVARKGEATRVMDFDIAVPARLTA